MSADLSRRCGPVVSGPVQQRRNPRRGEARELPGPTGSGAVYGNQVPGATVPGCPAASWPPPLQPRAGSPALGRSSLACEKLSGLLVCSEQGNVVPWSLRLGPAPSLNVSMFLGK